MAEQGYEYEQYAPQAGGRLFSSAMFGFNKEEVLEYLDELADENYMHQAAAEQQIADLNQMLANLQVTMGDLQQNSYDQQTYFEPDAQTAEELEIARAATQQAEGELAELREHFQHLQQENEWYRDAYQKNDVQIAELHRQLNDATSGRWADINENEKKLTETEQQLSEKQRQAEEHEKKIAELQSQVDGLKSELTRAQNNPEKVARESIIADANAEADRIRAVAMDERDRIRRQIRSSAGNIAESITTLRGEIGSVESDVTSVLEAVQKAMNEVHSALGRTEQSLSTLGVQANRFPSATPPVSRSAPQQPLYLQSARQPATRARLAAQPESFGTGGFRRLEPTAKDAKVRSFQPTAQPLAKQPSPHDEERIRALAENLVDNLVAMLT